MLNRFINLVILVKENAAYLVSAAGISSTLGTQKVQHRSTIEIKVKFNRDEIHKGHFDENLWFWLLAHSQPGFFFSILGIPGTLGLDPEFISHCLKV